MQNLHFRYAKKRKITTAFQAGKRALVNRVHESCVKCKKYWRKHCYKVYFLGKRCQLLWITSSHYGKLQKISVFYGLWKTRIFLPEIFKIFSLAYWQWIFHREVLSASTCRTLRITTTLLSSLEWVTSRVMWSWWKQMIFCFYRQPRVITDKMQFPLPLVLWQILNILCI